MNKNPIIEIANQENHHSMEKVKAAAAAFDLEQRMAAIYSQSDLVPKDFRGKLQNVMIALRLSEQMKADPLLLMQNMFVIHGNPGFSAKFLIACFNADRHFTSIRYRFTGERGKDSWGCIAHCTEKESGELIEGTEVTMAMAKAEGWSTKAGSKWKTMPEQMLRYRSATFLIRSTSPGVGLGLAPTSDELNDIGGPKNYRPRDERLVVEPESVIRRALEGGKKDDQALESQPKKTKKRKPAKPTSVKKPKASPAIEPASDQKIDESDQDYMAARRGLNRAQSAEDVNDVCEVLGMQGKISDDRIKDLKEEFLAHVQGGHDAN